MGIKKAIVYSVPGKLISFIGVMHYLEVCSMYINTNILLISSMHFKTNHVVICMIEISFY